MNARSVWIYGKFLMGDDDDDVPYLPLEVSVIVCTDESGVISTTRC